VDIDDGIIFLLAFISEVEDKVAPKMLVALFGAWRSFRTYIMAEMVARMNAEVLNVSILPLKVHLKECTKNRHDATTMPVAISTAKKAADRLACLLSVVPTHYRSNNVPYSPSYRLTARHKQWTLLRMF
jgi:hypothetical protein